MKSLNIEACIDKANEYINVPYLRYQSEPPRLVKAWQAEEPFVIRFGKRLNSSYEALNGRSEMEGRTGDIIVIEEGKAFVMTPYRFRGYFTPAST